MLISHIRQTVPLTNPEAELVRAYFQRRDLDRKEIFLFKGDISNHMRFVASGCLRSYYVDDAGQEHILQLAVSGWWINDLYSYLTRTPARHFIQALEPSTVLTIHRERLEELFDQCQAVERFFRLKIQSAYVAQQDRTLDTMSKSAEERYLEFRERYRDLEQRVPQYMVASYLGVSPEHLSTIRKKLSGMG